MRHLCADEKEMCIRDRFQGSVEHMNFTDASFDVVTAFETVYFWPGLPKCFQEVYRVLKPGGIFLICNEKMCIRDR